MSADSKLYDHYLAIIGARKESPSLPALERLVLGNITRIPFENISKLYYFKKFQRRTIPDFETYLEGIEKYNLGGTCHSNNIFLNQLLKYLGYDARLCGADMTNPDVHVINIVSIEKHEFIVDCGYAAPFVKPLPRDLPDDQIVELGSDRYVLHPQDSNGYSRVDMYRNNDLIHGYTAKPMARSIDYFKDSIANSFSEQSNFMNSIMLVRFYGKRSIAIRNYKLIFNEAPLSEFSDIANRTELIETVKKHFSIPPEIVTTAIEGLNLDQDIYD